MIPHGPLVAHSYWAARRLGKPVPRPPAHVVARVRPTIPPNLRPWLVPRQGWWEPTFPGYGGWGGRLGQDAATVTVPPAQITLPDGSTHSIQGLNTSGEVLTTDGWQSFTSGGEESWVNVHTGAVMAPDGTVTTPGQGAASGALAPGVNWWYVGAAGVPLGLLLIFLATQGAPVAAARARTTGRAAWAAWRGGSPYRRARAR